MVPGAVLDAWRLVPGARCPPGAASRFKCPAGLRLSAPSGVPSPRPLAPDRPQGQVEPGAGPSLRAQQPPPLHRPFWGCARGHGRAWGWSGGGVLLLGSEAGTESCPPTAGGGWGLPALSPSCPHTSGVCLLCALGAHKGWHRQGLLPLGSESRPCRGGEPLRSTSLCNP